MPIGAGMIGVGCGQRDRRVSKESYWDRAASSQAGKDILVVLTAVPTAVPG